MPDLSADAAQGREVAVSVVVPVHNGAATIVACLSSLLAVRYPPDQFEIVVVDNGSTDGTRDAVRAFGDRVRLIGEPVRGAAAARNAGIRAARGALVAFTDADCVVEPGWLAALADPLADARVGVVGGQISSGNTANRIERFGDVIHDHRRAIELEDDPYVIAMNWASRREVLLEAGLFDPGLLRGQDVDLAWRIQRAGYRLVYAPLAIVRHRNERTAWGLLHEGFVHGLHNVRIVGKHASSEPRLHARPLARLGRDLRQVVLGEDRVEGLLALLFDTGKAVGMLVSLARGRAA